MKFSALKSLIAARPLSSAVVAVALAAGAIIAVAETSGTDMPWSAATATPSPEAAPTATASAAAAEVVTFVENTGGGGGTNNVRVINHCGDGRFRARANIELNRIYGPTVSPTNLAYAEGTGANCLTVAVALQINLYQRGAPRNTPENAAVAINMRCTSCFTYARAIQFVIPTDDPRATPKDVDDLVKAMDRELRFLASMQAPSESELIDALGRITAVIEQFRDLAQHLREETQETRSLDSPTPTPSPTPPATPTPTATPSPTATP